MRRIFLVGVIMSLTLTLALAGRGATADDRAGRRYMGAFWYELARPIDSFKYQLYDIEGGEFDRVTVDRWLGSIRANYPGHAAYVREIRTEEKDGPTRPTAGWWRSIARNGGGTRSSGNPRGSSPGRSRATRRFSDAGHPSGARSRGPRRARPAYRSLRPDLPTRTRIGQALARQDERRPRRRGLGVAVAMISGDLG